MKDEALKLVLEVLQINLKLLEKINPYKGQEDLLSDSLDLTHKAITAIKQALAAPVQEPDHSDELTIAYMSGVHRGKELAARRQRVVFPTMLRKMWSGGEVQEWLDENVNKENT